jgi:SNF2 family DNA or RNA helicase
MTPEQQNLVYHRTGSLFADRIGGITSRSVLSQIAKGNYENKYIPTNKPGFIRTLIESWPDESTIVWCLYNKEQEILERELPEAASLKGSTPFEVREALIDDFKAGRRKVLISKPKILGFGLNLEIATRQIFSGLQDSWESYYQAVKRSNRYGATKPLNVHIPLTDVEYPMVATVMRKADRVDGDTRMQERMFANACCD